jgi:hypothetical protein
MIDGKSFGAGRAYLESNDVKNLDFAAFINVYALTSGLHSVAIEAEDSLWVPTLTGNWIPVS